MSDLRKKLKAEKKARAKKEKAKAARALKLVEKKTKRQNARDAPESEKPGSWSDGKQASSKPSSRPGGPSGHRTQGK